MSLGVILRDLFHRVFDGVQHLVSATRGNVAMIFALSLVPLAFGVGAGLDYARAVMLRASMEQAIDAAALAVGGTNGLTASQMQTMAQQYFNANYKGIPPTARPAR